MKRKNRMKTFISPIVFVCLCLLCYTTVGANSAQGRSFREMSELASLGSLPSLEGGALSNRYSQIAELFGLPNPVGRMDPFLVAPSISSISPSTPQTSVTDQNVRVNGSNF